MIHIYEEIAGAIAGIDELQWIDIAPRNENHTNVYPAAYIGINGQRPLNPLGAMNGIAEVDFSIEVWLKPYHSSAAKPLSPVIADLKNNFNLIAQIRNAIMNCDGEFVGGTTLISEIVEKQEDGFYRVIQNWGCVTQMWVTEFEQQETKPDVEFG
ncbi:MAG: hypothetical protein LBK94_13160 [Prevotellaceae bacterium]|jgi:hypothetical protein|nr:hypothetical protein [Prevotellaceae bacterium]